jgi:hypothetical protein
MTGSWLITDRRRNCYVVKDFYFLQLWKYREFYLGFPLDPESL